MRRTRIIISAIILAILGSIIPMLGAYYISWLHAVELEKKELNQYVDRLIMRALISVNGAEATLLKLQEHQFANACSQEHIDEMRKLTLTDLAVEEIGYFENNVLKCSIWGEATKPVAQFKSDFVIRSKFDVTLHARSSLNPEHEMLGLMYGHYVIYINAERLMNIIVPHDIQLALVHQSGVIIATLNNPSAEVINNVLSNKETEIHDKDFVVQRERNGIYAIAMEPISNFYRTFRSGQLLVLPFGLLTALFIIGLVLYYSKQRLSLTAELKDALKNDQFILYYQPIVDAQLKKCIGAEALIRWRRPNGEILSPDLFIPFAAEAGILPEITLGVIDLVLKDLKNLLVANREMHVSINITAEDIQSQKLLNLLDKKLENSGIDKNQIWLELSEREMLESASTKESISIARGRGYKILIDDFGTGYSNLSYLNQIPIDILKIDKLFVDTIKTQSATSTVTEHIIVMAKELNLGLIAEGVEKQEQLDYLLERGVRYIQGYLFSKPLPLKTFLHFCKVSHVSSS